MNKMLGPGSCGKGKLVVVPYRKVKQVRSNKQALSEITNGLKALAKTLQNNNEMVIEKERKREHRYLSFRREEVGRNRHHELRISHLFGNASQPQFPYRFQLSHQANSRTSSTHYPYQPVEDDIRGDSLLFSYAYWFNSLFNSLINSFMTEAVTI